MQDIDQLMTDILGVPKVKNRALRDLIDARMKKGGEATIKRGLRTLAAMDTGKVEMRKAPGAGGAIGKNVGRGMAGLRRSREPLDPKEIQAMMLDVPAGVGIPFAEAGAEYLRGNVEDAETSAAIDAALTAVPVVSALAKPAYRAVKSGVKKAAPAVREAARGALESTMESGAILDPRMQAIAYHGSPHKFEKFDASKIGTGEGAQAYGHGLYFAESPETAQGYATTLANRDVSNQMRLNAHANAQRLAKLAGPENAADDIKYALSIDPNHPQKKLLSETLELLESGRYELPLESKGHLYTVDIPDESVARMLDWDKPLSEQPEAVQKVARMFNEVSSTKVDPATLAETKGQSLLWLPDFTSAQKNSEAWKRAGIPGIKYLDADSRVAGKGTRNFVVFPGEEESVKILERKKKGGAVEGYAKGGSVQAAPYGLRETSGMPKGKGYFGELPTADGVMTELSTSDDAGDFPLIVPTLTREELDHLQSGGQPTEEIYAKAKAWAESRKAMGRDPFATSEDLRMPVPEYAKGGEVRMADGGEADSDDNVLYASRGQRRYGDSGSGEGALKSLYGMALNQAQSELKDAGPQAITDVANGILADTLGLPVDMVNTMLGSVGLGSKRPIGGSEQIRELMRDYGVTSGTERPLTEAALSILGPGAPRAATKMANVATVAAKRPFTPATLTVEGTAPDLGQGTSYGFRQGLNDVLLADINKIGRRPATTREGVGTYLNEAGELETNPMLAVDIPKAGRIGEGGLSGDVTGAVRELRQKIAQGGVDLNQEAMAAHRFIPLPINDIRDASAMLIKSREGLDKTQIAKLATLLGNDMVVAHNPRLGGIVVYPFGPVGKDVPKEFQNAEIAAKTILGKKAQIQYGVSDYDADRLFMMKNYGDYEKAGSKPMSAEQFAKRKRLQGIQKTLFPDTSGIPGNVKAAPLGGIQGWSRGKAYPTHVQGVGTKPDWQAINYATEERGPRRSSIEEAQEDQISLLDKYHRALVGRNR